MSLQTISEKMCWFVAITPVILLWVLTPITGQEVQKEFYLTVHENCTVIPAPRQLLSPGGRNHFSGRLRYIVRVIDLLAGNPLK